MRVNRIPGRDEALMRLCEAEPPLCEMKTRNEVRGLWALAILLLALGLLLLPARAQSLNVYAAAKRAAVTGVESVGMTVSDMDASVEFYTRVLTFEKVSDVEVAGEEYERLQGLFGVRMRVVRLRLGEETIELTEYLAPKGRPAPADLRANDLLHWQTGLVTENAEGLAESLSRAHYSFVSDGVTSINGKALGFRRGFLVADPDGHVMRVAEY